MSETAQQPTVAPAAEPASTLTRLHAHASDAGRGLGSALAGAARLLAELVTLSPLAALLGLAALGAAWYEHGQRLRQAGELSLVQRQTQSDVSQLQSKAAGEIQEANQANAQQVVALELARQKLAGDQATLRQRLAALEQAETSKAAAAAALPASEVLKNLAARLELAPGDAAAPGGAPAAAAPPAGSTGTPGLAGLSGSGTGRSKSSAPSAGQTPPPAPAGTDAFSGAFTLSEPALRKISSALDQLDSCRAEAGVRDGLVSNCQQQSLTSAAIINQQRASLSTLNQALADKDQIIAKRDQEHQAELKIARGTFTGRIAKALEQVAIGFALGYVARR